MHGHVSDLIYVYVGTKNLIHRIRTSLGDQNPRIYNEMGASAIFSGIPKLIIILHD